MRRIAFIAGGLVCGIVILILVIPDNRTAVFPDTISLLKLVDETHGVYAQGALNEFQKNLLDPEDYSAAFYFSTNGCGQLSVFLYSSREAAEEQYDVLTTAIRKEKNQFQSVRKEIIDGKGVYYCTGFNQTHYIFLSERDVYWWSADPQIALASAKDLVRFAKSRPQK